jgi:ferritin
MQENNTNGKHKYKRYAHTHQANKVLSAAANTEDSKQVTILALYVAELQDNVAEMTSIIGKLVIPNTKTKIISLRYNWD